LLKNPIPRSVQHIVVLLFGCERTSSTFVRLTKRARYQISFPEKSEAAGYGIFPFSMIALSSIMSDIRIARDSIPAFASSIMNENFQIFSAEDFSILKGVRSLRIF